MEFNRRERALISRGYSEEEVIRLCSFTKEELDFAVDVAFSRISKGVLTVSNPAAIFIGGQPGSGKSSVTMMVKQQLGNIVEIIIDNYRSYHPRYLEMEECIKRKWIGRESTNEDTPGNDIADFTHRFVSDITDRLMERAAIPDKDGKMYNMVVEWGMRDVSAPLATMNYLKGCGYTNSVKYISVHKSISWQACKMRVNIMGDDDRIVRNPPESFHQLYIDTLPDAVNSMYTQGYLMGIVDEMSLCLRDGTVIWNSDDIKEMPGEVYRRYLEDIELTRHFQNSREMARATSVKEIYVDIDGKNDGGRKRSMTP